MTDGQTRAVPLNLPGAAEADARAQTQRDFAFLALGDTSGLFAEKISGVPVRAMTMRHLLTLSNIRSCFLAGVEPPEDFALEEIVKFLRVIAKPLLASRRHRWLAKLRKIKSASHWRLIWLARGIKTPGPDNSATEANIEANAGIERLMFAAKATVPATLRSCQKYVDDAMAQMPGGGSKGGKDYYSHAAGWCHLICSNYGLTPAEAMDLPLNVGGQLFRVIRLENDPKAILFNPSDKLNADYLNKENRRN